VVAEAWHSALAMVVTYVITLSIFPVSKETEGADSNSAWSAMQCEHGFNHCVLVLRLRQCTYLVFDT
jgi:hypothetical protein